MPKQKESNVLQIWGNKDSMNLNSMILTNIQSSLYFKKDLYELKTYHEVIDEIFYRVSHLEPWEKGSRKTQGLTGMCGGVRGVGGGGIVSTSFCILYKLYTLKLTRKQVIGLINHTDSPYIRGLGFMYIRYTQAPQDLFDWYDEYLDDPEQIDVKAGGGHVMTIGSMLKQWLTRLEWFETLFPRIPVPIQNEISMKLEQRYRMKTINHNGGENGMHEGGYDRNVDEHEDEEEENGGRSSRDIDTRRSRSRSRRTHSRSRSYSRSGDERDRDRHRDRPKSSKHGRDKDRDRERDRDRDRDRSHSRHRHHRKHHKHHRDRKSKSRSRDREVDRGDSKNGKHSSSSSRRHHRHHHSNSSSKSKSPDATNSKKRSSRSRSLSKNRENRKKQRTDSP